MTVTVCDCCGCLIEPEDDSIRLDMRRPTVYDENCKVAIPSEYELCQLCGHNLEQELIKMCKEKEASK